MSKEQELIEAKKVVERLQTEIEIAAISQGQIISVFIKISTYQNGVTEKTFTDPKDASLYLATLSDAVDKKIMDDETKRKNSIEQRIKNNGGVNEPYGY